MLGEREMGETRETFTGHKPEASDLRTFLVFSGHPK